MIIEQPARAWSGASAIADESVTHAPHHFPLLSRGLSSQQGETDLRSLPATVNSGPSTIELAGCRFAADDPPDVSTHGDLRRALAVERARIRHMCQALACTGDGDVRQRWQAEMADSLARVRKIERTLRAGASSAEQRAADMVDECLLEAVELARADGDARTAETVAMECMALVEMRCMRIRQGSIGQSRFRAGERTHPLQGATP
jgi:hypothetical protein